MQVVLKKPRSSWAFSPDTPYSVYAMNGVSLRLVDDEGGTALWPRSWFRVVDPSAPPDWRLGAIEGRGRLHLGPAEACRPGYFEQVFNRAPGSDAPIRTSASLTPAERARFGEWFDRAPWAQAISAVKLGIFDDVSTAIAALTQLERQVLAQGWPAGSAGRPDWPREVVVPVARGAWVVVGVTRGHVHVEGSIPRDRWETEERARWTTPPAPLGPVEPARPEPGPLTVGLRASASVSNLSHGRRYRVLEIVGMRLRLIGDDGAPNLFSWDDLEPIDRTLGPGWQVQFGRNGTVRVVPDALASFNPFAARVSDDTGGDTLA